jgi:hypothetical protein
MATVAERGECAMGAVQACFDGHGDFLGKCCFSGFTQPAVAEIAQRLVNPI